MATCFVCVAAGATSAPLNPRYKAPEFDFYLSDLNARAIILLEGSNSPARQVAEAQGIPVLELCLVDKDRAGVFTLEGNTGLPPVQSGFARVGDEALVLHTSGTTSRPKIVPLTQANLMASAKHIADTLQLTIADRCLNVMPLFHIHGLMGATLSTFSAGASLVCTPGFNDESFFEWLADHKPTWYSAVPTMHQALLRRSTEFQDLIAANPIRFARSSSASLPPVVMAELERVFSAPVIESYGMTEAAHQMASNPLPPGVRKPGSVGLPAGPEIAIMDAVGNILAQGLRGEIVIRGPNVTPGYENNPIANQSAFTNGWFRTGDEGYIDQDGYLFITGRIKEMINRGGEKITPREVDEVFLDHPAVGQAVTFAVPHNTLGEDIATAVVLKDDAEATQKQLRNFAFTRLAGHKVPSQVLLVDQIPKGPTGKLQRIGLSDRLKDQLKAEHRSPQGEIESILADLWCEILAVEAVGAYDNFFACGGDSLLATRLNARVRAAFQVELPQDAVFREPTIAELAIIVEGMILDELEAMDEEQAQELSQ
jgi:acyl-CoA synthetase (AMP-forming)/AMP-acid ligase II